MPRKFLCALVGLGAVVFGPPAGATPFAAAPSAAAASLPALQQADGIVGGTVVEEATGRPIPNVQVVVVGTRLGGVSDAAGRFRIVNVPGTEVVLRTQQIGMKPLTQTVRVGDLDVRLALTLAAIQLDQVIVTGTAGGAEKRSIGNAVTTVNAAEAVRKAPIATVTQLLQGKTPGVTIMPGAGTAGTAASVRIRGAGSLNASNQPIYVIDGIRISGGSQGGYSVLGQSTSALDAIAPEDIESIEVIKGPAAATLYGADAAAGVIQIITKRGRAGTQNTEWSLRAERGNTVFPDSFHPTNYTVCTAARIRSTSWPGCAGLDSLAPVAQRILADNPLVRDSNALRQGSNANYVLSTRGGGERYSFFFSGTRTGEDGVFYNNWFRRTSGRSNLFVQPIAPLDVSVDFSYARTNTRLPLNDNASNGLLRNAYRGVPGAAATFAPGYRGLSSAEVNIYNNELKGERFIVGTNVNYRPTTWFRNRLALGLDMNNRLNTLFFPIDTTGMTPYGADNATGFIGQDRRQTHTWTVDYAATLSRALTDDINGNLSGGMQLTANRFESLTGEGTGLASNAIRLVSSALVNKGFEDFSEQNSAGFFVQAQADWRNRLFLTGALRRDDNSAFGTQFKGETYPKLQASYVISEEPWFALPMVNLLRLRGAWGTAGNAPSPFSADRTYEAAALPLEDGSFRPALRSGSFGNPNLKAETGEELEVGFDASLFGDRSSLEFTFYDKQTHDALISIPVPPSSGFGGSVQTNVGTISNRGVELALDVTALRSALVEWSSRATLATNRNRLRSWGGARDEPIAFGAFRAVQRHTPGYPLAGYWGWEVQRNADGSLVLANGRPVSADTNYIGPSAPTRELALSNTITLARNIRLYGLLDYKGGHYMWSAGEFVRSNSDRNAWRVNDPQQEADSLLIYQNGSATTPFIQKADFLKLREVSIAFIAPEQWASRARLADLTLTLSGRNLKTWTKYDLGPDPELNFSGVNDFSRTDYMSVPPLRVYLVSIGATF